jgi:thiosulfate reductase cytochrome b subunit
MEHVSDPVATSVSVGELSRAPATRAVVERHHALVRWTHWLNIPILSGLILSGMTINSGSPVYQHAADPITGSKDYIADAGIWLCAHVPGLRHYRDPPDWIYNHFGWGGRAASSTALRMHWLFAYLFMLNGVVYLAGLVLGGGYRALIPRLADIRDALAMMYYYAGVPVTKLARRVWPRPQATTKYNALQRLSYFAMPVAGTLAILTGWAIHKPMQMQWLPKLFGGYDAARVWHFWLMWLFVLFIVPHVVLVLVDGWDTMRSMVVGWSDRTGGHPDE